MTARVPLIVAVLAMTPAAAVAQAVVLRFAPVLGARATRVFQTHTSVTVRAPVAGAGPVVETRELADLGGTTELVLQGPDGRPVVHVTVDSLRTRQRDGEAPWQESEADLDNLWFQLRFDPRLHLLGASRADRVREAEALMHLTTGVPGLTLPEQPVRAGDSWLTEMAMPLSVWVMRPSGADAEPSLAGRVTVVVDSLVPRGQDTLAYLSVSGVIAPDTPELASASVYGGGVTGTLVWSTGWSAFVSGATRVRVHLGGSRDAGADGPRTQVTVETTLRQQIRS